MTNARENLRRSAVRTCEIFFILILLEGVIRKWIFRSFEQPFVLIRDPVLLVIYAQYIFYIRGRFAGWAIIYCVFVLIFAFFIFIQTFYFNFPVTVYLVGVRNYLAFAPLAFIMPEIYNRRDVNRLILIFLYTTIPVGVLAVFQFYSPVDSLINQTSDLTSEGIFTVVEGVVRPYGPFSFTLGESTYQSMALAIGLIALERRRELRLSSPLLIVFFAAIGSGGVVSGSRTYFVSAGVIFFAYFISAMTSPNGKAMAKRALSVAFVAVFGVITMTVVFPKAFETMMERQAEADYIEGSNSARALDIGTEVFTIIGDTPVFGHGIGFGSNAGAFLATGDIQFTLAEYDWTRIVLECGPFLGVIVIMTRVFLTILAGVLALRANTRTGDAAPLILYGFVAPIVFYSQMSNNNSMISFGWYSLGLLLTLVAAAKRANVSRNTRHVGAFSSMVAGGGPA